MSLPLIIGGTIAALIVAHNAGRALRPFKRRRARKAKAQAAYDRHVERSAGRATRGRAAFERFRAGEGPKPKSFRRTSGAVRWEDL